MNRAEAAVTELEAACAILALAGEFCAKPESYRPFTEWVRSEIRTKPASQARKDGALKAVENMSPEVLHGAAAIVGLFLEGWRDQLSAVPDGLLDAAIRKAGL